MLDSRSSSTKIKKDYHIKKLSYKPKTVVTSKGSKNKTIESENEMLKE